VFLIFARKKYFRSQSYFSKEKKFIILFSKIGFVLAQALTSSEYLLSVKSSHFLGIFLNLNFPTAPTPLYSCTWNILPVCHRNYPVFSSDVNVNDSYGKKMSDSLDLDFREVLMSWRVGLGVVATNLGHPLLPQI
jgi:hypothetical protein